jgi:hypothetical protein
MKNNLVGRLIDGKNPNIVDWRGDLDCSDLKLESLEGAPTHILKGDGTGGFFKCNSNKLITLEHGPESVAEHYSARENLLTSLKGAPKLIPGFFSCTTNDLESLEDGPSVVHGTYWAASNVFTSLHDIHKHIKEIGGKLCLKDNPIVSHVLGVLFIKGVQEIDIDVDEVKKILNEYLKKTNRGHKEILECKFELIDKGFDEFAKL